MIRLTEAFHGARNAFVKECPLLSLPLLPLLPGALS